MRPLVKAAFRLLLFSGLLGAGALFAQDEASAPAPTLVLPQVTLNIEDLSVEKVEAMLPPASEATLARAGLALPDSPVFAIQEPARQLAVQGSDPLGGASAAERPLATQATLGLGSQDRAVGRLNVTTVGGATHSSLSFAHETADGISGKAPGSGFDTRDDTIRGSLSGKIGPLDGSFQGGYAEKNVGLQGQSPYIYRLSRTLDGTAGLSVRALDWLSVDGTIAGTSDSLTLGGGSPPGPGQASEYKAEAHLGATARAGIFSVGIAGDYGYRTASMVVGTAEQVQRVRAGLTLGLDFPGSVLVEGTAGWFSNTQGLGVFPFSLHLAGVALSVLTFDVSFGYKVVTYDEQDIFALSPYLVPVTLMDDNGWFGDAALQLALPANLSVKVGGSFMASSAMPTSPSTPDASGPMNGLFPVSQQSATRLTGNTGLRWNPTPGITVDARWKHEFMDRPFFEPLDELTGEAIFMEGTGAYGGQLAVSWLTGPDFSWMPELDVGGFVRLSGTAQLRLDLYDLLWFFLDGQRFGPSLPPYVEPGFRAVASVRLSF